MSEYNIRLLAMPHIATSCCVLKASLCRVRSCILWNSFFAWSHAKDQRGESLILGGLLHPVAASLVLLVSTRPILALCVRMTRIQRGQEDDTRWTVQPPHALCRAELAEPLSADSAQTEPLRSDQR